MIKFNNSDIIDWNFDDSNIIKVYHNGAVCYYKITSGGTPPTPTGSTCYEVINDPITAYTATTYDSAYSFADSKWYMKNNLSQYEEYGIYDTANTLSDLTYYDGKLAAVGTTEYQYSGGTWVSAGTYVTTEVTYDIPSGYSTTYQGQTIPTTFKISVADMNVLGTRFINIYDNTNTSYFLRIGKTSYLYYGSPRITGTVTSDSDYYYFTLTDSKPSIEIYRTRGYNGTVHIITEQSAPSVEYSAKTTPSSALTYSSVAEMEAVECPTVGVGQYCYTNGQAYKFTTNEEWVTAQDSELAVKAVFADGSAKMLPVGALTEIKKGLIVDGNPNYTLETVYVGNGVTYIGASAFTQCKELTSVTISSSVTAIGNNAFRNDEKITRFNSDTDGVMNIPDTVTSIGSYTFSSISGITTLNIGSGMTNLDTSFSSMGELTSVSLPNTLTTMGMTCFYNCVKLSSVTIPSGVTRIEAAAFRQCSGLTSITCLATTPPSMTSKNAFENTNNCPIYVPASSVDTYKTATNWSTYASRIKAIT